MSEENLQDDIDYCVETKLLKFSTKLDPILQNITQTKKQKTSTPFVNYSSLCISVIQGFDGYSNEKKVRLTPSHEITLLKNAFIDGYSIVLLNTLNTYSIELTESCAKALRIYLTELTTSYSKKHIEPRLKKRLKMARNNYEICKSDQYNNWLETTSQINNNATNGKIRLNPPEIINKQKVTPQQ